MEGVVETVSGGLSKVFQEKGKWFIINHKYGLGEIEGIMRPAIDARDIVNLLQFKGKSIHFLVEGKIKITSVVKKVYQEI